MTDIDLGNYRKARVWVNELPFPGPHGICRQILVVPGGEQSVPARLAAVECYAMLGGRFQYGLLGGHKGTLLTERKIGRFADLAGRGFVKCDRILIMNLAVLKKSRGKPASGDVFAILPPDGLYLYGRTNVNAGGFVGSNLIYIYRARSENLAAVPKLMRGQLLLPPIMTNNLPWARGYFQFIENRALEPMDKLRQHCFKDDRNWYFDQYGNQLPRPVEPVGDWGLHSFRTIDDAISKALGIPVAPDD